MKGEYDFTNAARNPYTNELTNQLREDKGEHMSIKDMIMALLDILPDYKVGYALAYIQGLAADEYENYKPDTENTIEEHDEATLPGDDEQ